MNGHNFKGKWITNDEFASLAPRNVFHRQLDKVELDCSQHRNRHILFRKHFSCEQDIDKAMIYISADDYYKLYINGQFVAQGPSASYHFQYNYNTVDVAKYLHRGENVIAVHTLYQGLINRVWQSGDNRHGLILDLTINDETVVFSDESFKTAVHSAYKEMGVVGYSTGFLEQYDCRSKEIGFEAPAFDDSYWASAKLSQFTDHTLRPQSTDLLVFEQIKPVNVKNQDNYTIFDFGSNYVGYLCARVSGKSGDTITVQLGQDLDDDGTVRYILRANCTYEEAWLLADGTNVLDQFDYKAFRYAQLTLPEGCVVEDIYLNARHYPFELTASLKSDFAANESLNKIWQLCVHTQKYGVQEAVLGCMEREKGFYVGDGCYTALTHMVLTGDDCMVRKLINDAFSSDFITDGLVTCLNCSQMQEIAEYPLMLIKLVLWHYRLTGDIEFLKLNYPKVTKLLESYRRDYEKDYLLGDLDKWCVVEWPDNFRDGYDVSIAEGFVCHEPHISINAYYIESIKIANSIAKIIGTPEYREEKPFVDAFIKAFYIPEKHLFKDGLYTHHTSFVGNIFPFAYGLCPDEKFTENILKMIKEKSISAVSFFCAFPLIEGLVRHGHEHLIYNMMTDENAWLRMLREDATTTFEGWGKDTKWNTSLFHLTMSYGAVFLADIDLKNLFSY